MARWHPQMARRHSQVTRRVERIDFRPEAPHAVLERMAAVRRDASGWMNLLPGVDGDDVPDPVVGISALFVPRDTGVTMGTWAPGTGRQADRLSIGLQHSGGRFAVTKLKDLGVALPAGWKVNQDHPRRGIVLYLPAATADADALSWMVAAGTALCTIPITGEWRAEFHLRETGSVPA